MITCNYCTQLTARKGPTYLPTYICFFANTADTRKEGIEQHRKQECLKSVIRKGKVLVNKKQCIQKRIDKASEETINKTYAKYKQHKLNEKGKNMGRT